ncbi:MAG: biotin/lipoyl-binding protein [Dehalococcoidales bacterium]|nr:biotin/lipoyl-binding protein [Dehalococcoidales bacterium]
MRILRTLGVLSIIVTLLLGAAACNPFAGAKPVESPTATVTRGDLTVTVSGDGTIEASRQVKLSFNGAGKLTNLYVKKGDTVKKGDIIAKLDTGMLELAKSQAQVALAQAQVAVTQAKLAQQTVELTMTKTRDSKTALELAVYNAQVSRKIAEVALKNAEEIAPAPDLQAAIDKVNRAKIYLQYALDSKAASSGASTAQWDLVITRAQVDLDTAQAELDRITTGVDEDDVAIKKMQLEAANKTLTQAQKNLADIDRDITLQEAQIASAKDTVAQAERSVELAQKSLDHTQKQIDDATLTAPFDAIVTGVGAEEQEIVSSLNVIANLLDPAGIVLIVDVDEIDIPGVKVNQEALISVDALPDVIIKGTVAAVYPMPKTIGGVVQYEVKVTYPVSANPAVRIGMSAQADIITSQRSNVLLVPSRAIETDSRGNIGVNLLSNGQTQPRAVVAGVSDGIQTEIISGLNEGDKVVLPTRAQSSTDQGFFFGQ